MISENQQAMLESLADQIVTLWLKIGDKYATMTEDDVHRIVHKRGKTAVLRSSFSEYTKPEAARSIGLLMKVKEGYNQMWQKKWRGEVAEREAAQLEDETIVRECLIWEQVEEWMRKPLLFEFVPCHFEFVKKIGGVGYWRKREKTLKLFTHFNAEQRIRSFNDSRSDDVRYQLYDVFDPWHGPGYDGTLYAPKPQYEEFV